MDRIFIGFFDEGINTNDYNLYIIFYERKYYKSVINHFNSLTTDLEHWTCIRWGNEFYDMLVFTSDKDNKIPYRPVYTLRDVNTPFKENGQPKGWFYDENMKPKRYTGIGNSMFFSKQDIDTDFSVLCLYMMITCYAGDLAKVDSNMNSFDVVKAKYESLKANKFVSLIQDNSLKEYKSDGVFHFNLISLD